MTIDDLKNDGTLAMVAFDECRDEIIALVEAAQKALDVQAEMMEPASNAELSMESIIRSALEPFNTKLGGLSA